MPEPRPLLLVGSDTALGLEAAGICLRRRLATAPMESRMFDDLDHPALTRLLAQVEPWAIVDATGSKAAGAQLAILAVESGIPLLVFAGRSGSPFVASANRGNAPLLVRASDPFGSHFGPSPVDQFLEATLAGLPLDADPNEFLVPTYLPDVIDTGLDLLIDGAAGTWQLSHGLAISLGDLAEGVLKCRRGEGSISGVRIQGPDLRILLRPLEDALQCWLSERPRGLPPARPAPSLPDSPAVGRAGLIEPRRVSSYSSPIAS